MKKRRINLSTAFMLAVLAVVCTFNITFFTATEYYNQRLDDLEALENRYAKLKTVADIVEKYFVADYDEAEAVELALAGYVDGLGDRWSAYYTAEETAIIEADERNVYAGIGVSYSTEESTKFQITSVTPDGPADQAGIQLGDRLLTVDGLEVDTLESPDQLSNLVRGEVGTVVTLTLQRGNETLSFAITRANIRTYSVTSRMLEGQIGYIAVQDFDQRVDEEFSEHLDNLIQQGAKGFIFDVRNNPGGYLSVMRAMLDRLLPEGIVITTVDKQGREEPYTSDAAWINMPMVVVTNEYSISAAEFFAAALQEYGVATVVGGKTSGKGYSQQTFKLGDGSSVHISTTRYYTPKGNSLAETGVTPDQVVEMELEDLRSLISGKLEEQDDVQLQAAIQVMTGLLEQQPAEQPAEGTEADPAGGTETVPAA